jgi:hypothetical protein
MAPIIGLYREWAADRPRAPILGPDAHPHGPVSAWPKALIVLAHKPGVPTKDPRSINSAGYGIEFGVLEGNRFTPLPGAPPPGPNAWPTW